MAALRGRAVGTTVAGMPVDTSAIRDVATVRRNAAPEGVSYIRTGDAPRARPLHPTITGAAVDRAAVLRCVVDRKRKLYGSDLPFDWEAHERLMQLRVAGATDDEVREAVLGQTRPRIKNLTFGTVLVPYARPRAPALPRSVYARLGQNTSTGRIQLVFVRSTVDTSDGAVTSGSASLFNDPERSAYNQTGCRHPYETMVAPCVEHSYRVARAARLTKIVDLPRITSHFKIHNIVTSGQLPFCVDLLKLNEEFPGINFDPSNLRGASMNPSLLLSDMRPGDVQRPYNERSHQNVFDGGTYITTGMTSANMYRMVAYLYQMAFRCRVESVAEVKQLAADVSAAVQRTSRRRKRRRTDPAPAPTAKRRG